VSLYKCSDCGKVDAEADMYFELKCNKCGDEREALVKCFECDALTCIDCATVEMAHNDDCCCAKCDPDGIAQRQFSAIGRVL
jgi:DNA-directed RNA polymerase subunit RPC12/RpoP